MYQSFKITNFRCFHELNVTDLERVNLIAGVNNAGKTTLLEALFIHCGAYNPQLTLGLNAFRGIGSVTVEIGRMTETPWDSIFSEFDSSKEIKLEGNDKETGVRVLRLDIVSQTDEIAEIGSLIPDSQDMTGEIPSSLEFPRVLKLTNEENGQNSYYMILDQRGIRVHPIPPPPPFPTIWISSWNRTPMKEDAERFGKLELKDQLDVLTNALKIIEPRLRRLSVIVVGDTPIIYGTMDGLKRPVPLPFMGEGIARLTSIVLAIGNSSNGVVLVDEIENGFHHSVLHKVWQVLGEAARRFNTQVFATTHSIECIIAAHRAFMESETYDFRLHRLERMGETIQDITYPQEVLEAAIEMGLEVR
ncbi:MAG: ATPase [Methanosarcinales archaeon]|nr:MAG: ATPase [Methanosarcinales archaeon]